MKFTSFSALAMMAPLVSAHYFFDKLIIDGKETKSAEFVRTNTREAKYNPTKWENVRDDMTPDVTDFRCNKGSFQSASKTGTAEVKAGSKLAMKLAVGATMQHPGPALVYMSKAPTTAQTYEGDGDWFKIFEEAICRPSGDFTRDAWCTWDRNVIEFTIPKDLPDGEYLIRPEHIGIHGAHVKQAEFYYACAQVKVTGGGTGTPGPTVKFPGAYKKDDPSFNFSIYGGIKPYPMPGPPVWGGAAPASGTTGTIGSTGTISGTGSSSGNSTSPAPATGSTTGGSNNNNNNNASGGSKNNLPATTPAKAPAAAATPVPTKAASPSCTRRKRSLRSRVARAELERRAEDDGETDDEADDNNESDDE